MSVDVIASGPPTGIALSVLKLFADFFIMVVTIFFKRYSGNLFIHFGEVLRKVQH